MKQSTVKRFGINLGSTSYYDSSLITQNLLYRNPGFEGQLYQSIFSCSIVAENSCLWQNGSRDWPPHFWDGATYEFISGHLNEHRGVISDSGWISGENAFQITFAEPGLAPEMGDSVILRTVNSGNGQAGWWQHVCCGGSISTETKDLGSNGAGTQALRINNANGGKAEISSYFGYSANKSFVLLRGDYKLRFIAKALSSRKSLKVSVSRSSTPAHVFLEKAIQLSSKWESYELQFAANESSQETGMVQVKFAADGSDLLLDNVALEEPSTNSTVFRDSVVQALRDLHPGILRYWGGQLGDSLDNQLAPAFSRMRAGYSVWSHEQEDIRIGLNDFLELCEVVHAEPYYVLPITFSEDEIRNLIEFLAAESATPYGSKRAALGRIDPWTRAFPKIHLEFGNEAWNQTFRGGNIEDPATYGHRANDLFLAARQKKEFSADKFDLIIGGQAVDPARNEQILRAAGAQDTIAVAPYQMNQVDSFRTNQELFGPLFAEPQAITSVRGFMGRNKAISTAASKRTRLSIYEVNVDTLTGGISQNALNDFIPSLGTGIAVIEHMLLSLRDLGITDQTFWSLAQYQLLRGDGKAVRLYGAVVDMGPTDRKRPQYLALQLANRALTGHMLSTYQKGPDPTWDQPVMNGVPQFSPHAIESFAFASGAIRSLILLNLNVTGALDVTFRGLNAPRGRVTIARLRSPDVAANNEEAENVKIEQEESAAFDRTAPFLLPPHSMTVLFWEKR